MKKGLLIILGSILSFMGYTQQLKEETVDANGKKIKRTTADYVYSSSKNGFITSECYRVDNDYYLMLRITTTNTVYTVKESMPLIIKLADDNTLRLKVLADVTSAVGKGIQASYGEERYGAAVTIKLTFEQKDALIKNPIKLLRIYYDNVSDDYEVKSKVKNVIQKQLKLIN